MIKLILKAVLGLLAAQSACSFSPTTHVSSPATATATVTVTATGKGLAHTKHDDLRQQQNIFLRNGKDRSSSRSSSSLSMIMEPTSIMESSTTFLSTLSILSNENIKAAFSLATFAPQYLWILMIVLPNTQITKKVMGGYYGIIAISLIHLFIVIASATQENGTAPILEFNGVFDPSPDADPQAAMMGMMRYPNFVTEEWSHVLTWDLFVGRFIWLDGLKRGIFTPHSVLLTNLIGPPGFLLHCITCLVTGKGIPGSEVPEDDTVVENK